MPLIDARVSQEIKRAHRNELAELHNWIAETPAHCTVKGMYINGVVTALANAGIDAPENCKVHPFKDRPLREFMELLVNAAVTLYPDSTPKRSLRRLGRLAIPSFAQSVIGRVIMSTAGRNWELMLKAVSSGYEVSLKPGKAIVAEMGNERALLQLRNVWNFGDCYQVGVIEGLMESCDIQGQIRVEPRSRCDCDMHLDWGNHKSVSFSELSR